MMCYFYSHLHRAYSSQLVPHLAFASDEATLTTISELLECPLQSILKASLPSTMVLILPCWAQETEAGQERRQQATASHELLCRHMSEEVNTHTRNYKTPALWIVMISLPSPPPPLCPQVVGQTLRLSIDVFVIELLIRIFESPISNTHLAQFCLTSDPEPCPPHYSSHMIRATFDYMPTCYGSAGAGLSFLRLLSRRHVSWRHMYIPNRFSP